jgi:predicted transcriptional regulator
MDFKEEIKNRGLKISWVAKRVGISRPLLSIYLHKHRDMPIHIQEALKKQFKG